MRLNTPPPPLPFLFGKSGVTTTLSNYINAEKKKLPLRQCSLFMSDFSSTGNS
jgi:hypothetical protein